MPDDEKPESKTREEKIQGLRDQVAATPGDWHTAFLALCDVIIAGDDEAPAAEPEPEPEPAPDPLRVEGTPLGEGNPSATPIG